MINHSIMLYHITFMSKQFIVVLGSAGFSVGIVDGTATMLERMGYGIYELVTFWAPTYKCTYKPPYQGRCGMSGLKEYNPNGGLSEFPAELSFQSYYKYSRQQRD